MKAVVRLKDLEKSWYYRWQYQGRINYDNIESWEIVPDKVEIDDPDVMVIQKTSQVEKFLDWYQDCKERVGTSEFVPVTDFDLVHEGDVIKTSAITSDEEELEVVSVDRENKTATVAIYITVPGDSITSVLAEVELEPFVYSDPVTNVSTLTGACFEFKMPASP